VFGTHRRWEYESRGIVFFIDIRLEQSMPSNYEKGNSLKKES